MDDRSEWEQTALRMLGQDHQSVWRRYCDALNRRWLEPWLPTARAARALKTDLFDEAMGRGLYGLLRPRSACLIGQDLAVEMVGAARARYPDFAVVGSDVRRLPFAGGCLDLVVSNSTLDHFSSLAELVEALAEIFRVLRPGGWLLLTLDNLGNPAVALRNWLPASWLLAMRMIPYRMGATLSPRTGPRVLREVGFDVVESATFMHCPRLPAVLVSRLVEALAGRRSQDRFLEALQRFEQCSRWPTRFLTGYFLAYRACKPAA